jgi:HTH-type transcriptional regulator, transcriptional repressor of NAD biosynthesis genes
MVMKKYSHSLVVGKFMPLHTGHVFLLETAMEQCHRLTILVFSQPDESIPGELRVGWVSEQFPKAEVLHHFKPLPRDESGSGYWGVWKKSIAEHCGDREFDAVFSYGKRLADDLKAEHVEVDRLRKIYPVSGTDVRNNPRDFKEFIPEVVRPYFSDQLG